MPVYTYRCEKCSENFEKIRPMRQASEPQPCPTCEETSERVVAGIFENNSTKNRSANFPKRKRYTNW